MFLEKKFLINNPDRIRGNSQSNGRVNCFIIVQCNSRANLDRDLAGSREQETIHEVEGTCARELRPRTVHDLKLLPTITMKGQEDHGARRFNKTLASIRSFPSSSS